EDAECEAKVADAINDEGLDGGRVSRRLVIPEADQEIRRESHASPAEKELKKIVGSHQRQHGKGEQREISKEARPARIVFHVADGVKMHETRDVGYHHQHHGGERVDAE